MVTKPEDVEKVLTGKKTATRRNGRYADPGEIMVLEGKQFKVERVYRETLGDLTDESAVQEGFNNLEDYKNAILAIHPGMPWKAEMKVWVHEFKEV
ncbi:ASCH domain-containing protein [Salipaludibacillus sp. CUR1]|uniref:ASCH domain-containing protein n=1 Tax=Salipaludibacillus sp. CUR1 TaxID=2820003 RepID=UPI001E32BD45|nr:ASCH domain-containing protein [Salipaludibacillus sp. CUR1]MCE7791136.1 ASCH domain-containing protein [Salipaludibacillus sp. CUR1]